MGVRFPSTFQNVPQANLPATGAQTIIITSTPLTLPLDNAAVIVLWSWQGNTGAGTTSLTFTICRGTSVGVNVLVNETTVVTAGANFKGSGFAVDQNPGAGAGVVYSLQLTGTGTTGAGANGSAQLAAFVL
jgi:hypothetical protein